MNPAPFQRRLFRRRRLLLRIGIAAPLVAAIAVVAAAAAYPGFDNATQYLSALGDASAREPAIFNTGVLAAGLMAATAGLGFGLALAALSGARVLAWIIVVVFGLAGFGLVMASLYPMPDPRHQMINFGLGIQLAPLLLIWGLRRRPDLAALRRFLAAVFIIMAILTVLTKHLAFPHLVNEANVGWWERGYAIVLCGWVGVAAFVLERRLLKAAVETSQPPRD